MISVAIVDDHPVVRAGLRAVLGASADICLVAEASSGKDALRIVAETNPDVLVLDLNLPDTNGLQVTRQLAERKTRTAVLILTIHRDNISVFELLECGALGYVLKDEALETLVSAIRAVARGEHWLSPSVTSQVVRRAVARPGRGEHPPHHDEAGRTDSREAPLPGERERTTGAGLTPREKDVLCLLAQGYDNLAIARRLVLTTRTVQNHVSNIYNKLGTTNRTEAALYAIRNGIAPVPLREDERDQKGHHS